MSEGGAGTAIGPIGVIAGLAQLFGRGGRRAKRKAQWQEQERQNQEAYRRGELIFVPNPAVPGYGSYAPNPDWARRQTGVGVRAAPRAELRFLPEPVLGERTTAAPEPAIEAPRTGSGLSPALYLSAAARIAAAAMARTPPGVLTAQQPGVPPGTGSGVPGGPPPSQDPRVWAELVAYIIELIRSRKLRDPSFEILFPFPGEPPMPYQMSPFLGDVASSSGGFLGGLAQAGLSVASIISALRGAPMTMPGGAAIGSAVGFLPQIGGIARTVGPSVLGGLAGYFAGGQGAGVRGPSTFVCEDPAGNTVAVRKLGAALAFRGDITAVKRLKRAHRIIGGAIGGGRRAVGRRRPR